MPIALPAPCRQHWRSRVRTAVCSVRFSGEDVTAEGGGKGGGRQRWCLPDRVVVGEVDGGVTVFDTRMWGPVARLREGDPVSLFQVRRGQRRSRWVQRVHSCSMCGGATASIILLASASPTPAPNPVPAAVQVRRKPLRHAGGVCGQGRRRQLVEHRHWKAPRPPETLPVAGRSARNIGRAEGPSSVRKRGG